MNIVSVGDSELVETEYIIVFRSLSVSRLGQEFMELILIGWLSQALSEDLLIMKWESEMTRQLG